MRLRERSRQRGFSLIELLVVVAILGLLASIMLPMFLDALQKARQKRTMTDLRGIGTGWMSWLADQSGAASAGSSKMFANAPLTDMSFAELENYLRPTDTFFYVQDLPRYDAWGHEFRFRSSIEDILVCSPGRSGGFDRCDMADIPLGPFLATDYEQDMVWANGYFITWPDSVVR